MLTPIDQNDGVTPRERHLAALARHHLLRLWSYPGLSRREKNGVAQELADLTVVFGDDILLFSDKDETWSPHPDVMVAWSRWYRRAIEKSAKQLWGAEQYLRRSPNEVYLDPGLNKPFPFPLVNEKTRIHLIAVTANSEDAAQAHFDSLAPGSSSTLMFQFPEHPEEMTPHPFVVGDLDPKRTFVHVFDRASLDRVLGELGTIADLIDYLTKKAAAIRGGHLMLYAGEEDLLAFYLYERGADGYGALPFDSKVMRARLAIPEGEWVGFRTSDRYRLHAAQRESARPWGRMLDHFDASIVEANTGEANDTPLWMHERALRVAASENMASRARLAAEFGRKYNSVPTDARSASLVRSLCVPDRIYAFVFVPVPPDTDYVDYRAFRRALLEMYALVIPFKIRGVREVLVIGAQTRGSGGASETMIYSEIDGPLDEETLREAERVMREYNILDTVEDMTLGRLPAFDDLPRRFGRNEPCPCGSGRKNKKCCNLSGPRHAPSYGLVTGGEG
ncbi:SEC-C domain-containing protein [Luteibacter anthropi]|uniref:SEC-C metal-binding domain-containing protein n=1 Tax=Luteibacter anthropi TaxID=564369 RepID=UPI0020323E07|nr:SEC-C metal-binding domain-containing protein [Luteibacter anthropi]URX62087.1 SEC-C domain-containing protein [Luteibacter anthropi]